MTSDPFVSFQCFQVRIPNMYDDAYQVFSILAQLSNRNMALIVIFPEQIYEDTSRRFACFVNENGITNKTLFTYIFVLI